MGLTIRSWMLELGSVIGIAILGALVVVTQTMSLFDISVAVAVSMEYGVAWPIMSLSILFVVD